MKFPLSTAIALVSTMITLSSFITAQPARVNYSDSMPYRPRVFSVAEDNKDSKKKKWKKVLPPAYAPLKEPGLGPEIANRPITLSVSVLDANAKPVTGLTDKDFKVFVDAVEMKVEKVETLDEPQHFIFLLDVSGSLTSNRDVLQQNALALVRTLRPGDKAIIATFSDKVRVLTEFTDSRLVLENAIQRIKRSGNTSLFDAIEEVSKGEIPSLPKAGQLVLLTDGVDTTSRAATYASSLAALERSHLIVYPVYIDTFQDFTGLNNSSWAWNSVIGQLITSRSITLPGSSKESYEVGRLYLDDLVYASGGRAVRAYEGKDQHAAAPFDLRGEIASKYYVTFTPTINSRVGQRMHVKVRVNRPDLAVFARGSYIASN